MTPFSGYSKDAKKLIAIAVIALLLIIGGGFVLWSNYGPNSTSELNVSELEPPELVPVEWLQRYFGTDDPDNEKVGGYFGDPDQDKLNNYQEFLYGTDPLNRDTDGDLYFDGTEVAYGSDPLGEGGKTGQADLEKSLRQIGINFDRGEIEDEFGEYLDVSRQPLVSNYTRSSLNISNDNSQEAAETYYEQFQRLSAFTNLATTQDMANTLFSQASEKQLDFFIEKQTEVINNLLALPVPSELADLHLTYVKLYDGFLGMGKYARAKKDSGYGAGQMYPEVNYMLALDEDLTIQKIEAFEKFQLPI